MTAEGKATSFRILIVDDEPGIVEIYQQILERHGYIVDSAEDGSAALAKLNRRQFDMLLTDLNMPHTSGEMVIAAIKNGLGCDPRIPIVVVSGHIADRASEQLRELNVIRVLEKPLAMADLLEAVAACQEYQQARR